MGSSKRHKIQINFQRNHLKIILKVSLGHQIDGLTRQAHVRDEIKKSKKRTRTSKIIQLFRTSASDSHYFKII